MKYFIALLLSVVLLLPLVSHNLSACEEVIIIKNKKEKTTKTLPVKEKETEASEPDSEIQPDFMFGSSIFRF